MLSEMQSLSYNASHERIEERLNIYTSLCPSQICCRWGKDSESISLIFEKIIGSQETIEEDREKERVYVYMPNMENCYFQFIDLFNICTCMFKC
jgi:hypothetical protein